MRLQIVGVLVGAVVLLAGAPMALAKADQHRFTGTVSRLDSSAKTLAVKEAGGKVGKEMSFTLAPDAKIMQGPKAKSLAELQIGEKVKVTYADDGSAHRAERIEVLAARTAKTEPVKPSGTKPKAND